MYLETYCKCTGKYGVPAWCGEWSDSFNASWCILYGGLQSLFCNGAKRAKINGKLVEDYFSYDSSICNAAASRSSKKLFRKNVMIPIHIH